MTSRAHAQSKFSGMGQFKHTIVCDVKYIALHVQCSVNSSQDSAFAFFAAELSVISQQ